MYSFQIIGLHNFIHFPFPESDLQIPALLSAHCEPQKIPNINKSVTDRNRNFVIHVDTPLGFLAEGNVWSRGPERCDAAAISKGKLSESTTSEA